MLRLTAVLLILCAAGLQAQTTHTVTNLNDTGTGSLRDTAAAASSGDTIEFDASLAGTIAFGSEIGLGSTELTIIGNVDSTGAPVISFDGGDATRLLSTDAALMVENLNFANGNGDGGRGGAIWSSDTVTCTNCTFNDNTAGVVGGAILAEVVTCEDCTFNNNSAFEGGAIRGGTTVTCTNCTFNDNTAGFLGGAILAEVVTCKGCTFIGNGTSTTAWGGAIWGVVVVHCENCTFRGNSAEFGGAISAATVNCTGCTFSDNSAEYGGAISAGAVNCTNCTFSENSAKYGGAIASGAAGDSAFYNCTFSGNTANTSGGAIWSNGAVVSMNCIFADNGTGLMFAGTGKFESGGYNLCTSPASAGIPWLNETGDRTNIDPLLGPLQDNGGPVHTMLPDMRSPAIDGGGPVTYTTDARGAPRTVDLPWVTNAPGGDGTDIGAVEWMDAGLIEVFVEGLMIPNGGIGVSHVTATVRKSHEVTVTVGNSGGAPGDLMLVRAPTVSNESGCAVEVVSWPAGVIAPGAVEDFIVEVRPHSAGLFSFDLTIESADLVTPAYIVTVYGSAELRDSDDSGCRTREGGGTSWLLLAGLLATLIVLSRQARLTRP